MPRATVSVASVLADFARVARRLRIRWYVFGAQALVLRGLPRATADLDVTVLLGERPTERLTEALVAGGFSLTIRDRRFVATTRVLPIVHVESRFPVDVVLGGPGLEERFADAAESKKLGRTTVPVATAGDLVLMKVLAGRPKDLEDAVALLRTDPTIDARKLDADVAALRAALGEDDIATNLALVRRRARQPRARR